MYEYIDGQPCPLCGTGILTKKIIKETFEYKGFRTVVSNYATFTCDLCKEGLVDEKTHNEIQGQLIKMSSRANRSIMIKIMIMNLITSSISNLKTNIIDFKETYTSDPIFKLQFNVGIIMLSLTIAYYVIAPWYMMFSSPGLFAAFLLYIDHKYNILPLPSSILSALVLILLSPVIVLTWFITEKKTNEYERQESVERRLCKATGNWE